MKIKPLGRSPSRTTPRRMKNNEEIIEDDYYNCGFCFNQLKNPAKILHGVYKRPCSKCVLPLILLSLTRKGAKK